MTTLTTIVRSLATVALLAASTIAAAPAAHSAPDHNPFSGERRISLSPEGTEFALAIGKGGQATSTDLWGKRSMFVATRVRAGRYLLQTAELRRGGEPLCLKLFRTRVFAVACDASAKHQLFRFTDAGDTGGGDPTYTIGTGANRYLILTDEGAFAAAQISEGTPDIDTPFILVDRGRANLPALD